MKEEKKKLSTESNLGSLTLRGNRAWGEHGLGRTLQQLHTKEKKWCQPTVFHRSIAAATNYFVLQVPEATIRGRRLFAGGINKFIHTKLPCSSSVGALFSTAYSFKL